MRKQEDIQIKDVEDENAILKYAITSYGADFDVEGLIRRIQRGDIYVPTFQREYVWPIKQASRFIESLLLGLPVPGVFLSRERNSQRLLVLDGQQRLFSLLYFYEGIFRPNGKEFALTGLSSEFNGLTYRMLSPEDQRRLGDSIIHATVIRQDEPDDGDTSIYFIFERLNSGGTQLQPQEIRSALFHGPFSDLIYHLNDNPNWRSLYGPYSPKKRDEELILRFFALFFESDKYSKPMKDFLNKFMGKNRNLDRYSSEQLEPLFHQTVTVINDHIGNRAFKPKRALNAAIFDSVMIGVARRLMQGPIQEDESLVIMYNTLLSNNEYIRLVEQATTDEDTIRRRIALATESFKQVV